MAVLLLALGGTIIGVITAVMPQESNDRLCWWREWLGYRERMSRCGDSTPPTAKSSKTADVCGAAAPLPSDLKESKTVPPCVTLTPGLAQSSVAPAAEEELAPK